jgi:hypothetical protein
MATKRIVPAAGWLSISEPLGGLLELKNNIFLNLTFLLASVLALAPALGPVPSSNENIYLLYLEKLWDPNVLARDWTFAGPFYGHWIFSYLFGSLTLVFSLETVGWIGRVLSWSLILIALFRLGRHFAIPAWMISLSIFLWLLYQQSPVGGEWVLGTFEAKCIAYIFLFFSLSELIKGRDLLGSFLLGLCFTFHGVVGMWALLAVGLTVLFVRYPAARLIKMGLCVLLSAAPGLIVTLPTISGDWTLSQEQAKFLALVAAPFHLDPLSFPKRDVFLLLILFCFNWLYFRSSPNDKTLRFLNYFLLFLGLFSLMGVVARLTGNYRFLFYFPFRLFPMFVPLFFFFCLMSVCYHRSLTRVGGGWLLGVGILALLCLPGGAVGQLIDQTKRHYGYWAQYYDWDDLQKSFLWVSENTPPNSIIILPPWRKESFYLSRRATIVSWASPRMDRFKEWQERINALIGDFSIEDEHLGRKWEDHYNQLSETEIASIIAKYGGEYLVTEGTYNYPVLFDSGTYRVYSLPASGSRSTQSSMPASVFHK